MTETAIQLPAGYREQSAFMSAEYEKAARSDGCAWSVYEVSGDADQVIVHWRTNDDRDHGVPTEYAQDTFEVKAMETQGTALERALDIACGGGSRYGVGQVVLVYVNGRLVEKVG